MVVDEWVVKHVIPLVGLGVRRPGGGWGYYKARRLLHSRRLEICDPAFVRDVLLNDPAGPGDMGPEANITLLPPPAVDAYCPWL